MLRSEVKHEKRQRTAIGTHIESGEQKRSENLIVASASPDY